MLQSASQGRWAVIRIGVAYFDVCVCARHLKC